jgi:anti-anti-sigma regulatory factor
MSAKFLPTVLHGPGWTYIRLSGVIDEDNRLMDLVSEIRGDQLLLDVADVERINSCGVRDWVNWLTAVQGTRAETVLVDCSPAIVAQLNLVGNFTVHAKVLSFQAPYYCESCDREGTTVLKVESMVGQAAPRAPNLECAECRSPMVFDDIEESFFAFLREAQVARQTPEMAAVVKDARRLLGDAESTTLGGGSSGVPDIIRMTVKPEDPRPAEPAPALPAAAPPAPARERGRSLTRNDTLFYLAVGVLFAILIVVIYNIAVP